MILVEGYQHGIIKYKKLANYTCCKSKCMKNNIIMKKTETLGKKVRTIKKNE